MGKWTPVVSLNGSNITRSAVNDAARLFVKKNTYGTQIPGIRRQKDDRLITAESPRANKCPLLDFYSSCVLTTSCSHIAACCAA